MEAFKFSLPDDFAGESGEPIVQRSNALEVWWRKEMGVRWSLGQAEGRLTAFRALIRHTAMKPDGGLRKRRSQPNQAVANKAEPLLEARLIAKPRIPRPPSNITQVEGNGAVGGSAGSPTIYRFLSPEFRPGSVKMKSTHGSTVLSSVTLTLYVHGSVKTNSAGERRLARDDRAGVV
jgi:hypothetical protein